MQRSRQSLLFNCPQMFAEERVFNTFFIISPLNANAFPGSGVREVKGKAAPRCGRSEFCGFLPFFSIPLETFWHFPLPYSILTFLYSIFFYFFQTFLLNMYESHVSIRLIKTSLSRGGSRPTLVFTHLFKLLRPSDFLCFSYRFIPLLGKSDDLRVVMIHLCNGLT